MAQSLVTSFKYPKSQSTVTRAAGMIHPLLRNLKKINDNKLPRVFLQLFPYSHLHSPKRQRVGKKKTQGKEKKLLFFIGSEGKGFNSLEKTASFALHHLKAKIQDVPFHIPTRASFSAAAPQKNTNNIDF